MKKFIKQCILFGIIVILILAAIETSIRIIPNPYKFKTEWMNTNSQKVKTLILGSSYANYGINPGFIADSSFNLAMSGQSIKYDLELLKKYIGKMPNLKSVILGIGYQTPFFLDYEISDVLPGNREADVSYYIGWYKMYMGIKLHPFPAYSFELLHYRRAIVKWKSVYINHRAQMRCDSTGYDHDTKVQERSPNWYKAEELVEDNTAQGPNKEIVFKLCQGYLEEMISILKQQNAELVIVVTPTYHTFYETINKVQMNRVYGSIKELSEKYTNVIVYDYFKDPRFVEQDFYDANHLSDVGAEKFSRILRDTLFYNK